MPGRVAQVNAALRAAGLDARLLRGRGYHYFTGSAVDGAYTTSVMVFRADALTVAQWLDEFYSIEDFRRQPLNVRSVAHTQGD